MAVIEYYPPTDRKDTDSLLSGVGGAVVRLLREIGVACPNDVFKGLRDQVMRWSFTQGGTRLTTDELRAEFVRLLGSRLGVQGDVVDFLRSRPTMLSVSPTFDELEEGHFFREDEPLSACRQRLTDQGAVLIHGPAGSGKSALLRVLGWELRAAGWLGFHWDFEQQSSSLPDTPANIVGRIRSEASILNQPCWISLENVHLQPAQYQSLLEQVKRVGSRPTLAATSRIEEPIDTDSSNLRSVLRGVRLRLEPSEKRGMELLRWWLREEQSLGPAEISAVFRSTDWTQFTSDFQSLRLAYESFDFAKLSLPVWAVERTLVSRLETWRRDEPRLPRLLYLVGGLGRADIPADLNAISRMMAQPLPDTMRMVDLAKIHGLLTTTEDGHFVRYWHKTLANAWFEAVRIAGLGVE